MNQKYNCVSGMTTRANLGGMLIHVAVWPQYMGEAGSSSDTTSPGPRCTSVPRGIFIHPAVWPQQKWATNWGAVPLLGRGTWVPILHNVVEAYLHATFHLDLSNCLATIHQRYRQTDRTDNDLIAEGKVVYKRSPKNCFLKIVICMCDLMTL